MISKTTRITWTIVALAVLMIPATSTGNPPDVRENSEPTLTVSQAKGGGLLFKTDEPGRFIRAPELEAEVRITVRGVVARTSVRQRFTNPSDRWMEAVYVFPLPEGCAVDTLRMEIGDRIIEGRIKERAEAKRIYVEARASGRHAALLEQERPNMFTTSVANIGPKDSIDVTIEYQQMLLWEDGRFELRFPTVVGPRYLPGDPAGRTADGAGWGRPTAAVPDGDRITPPVVPPGGPAVNPLSLDVDLDVGVVLDHLNSPSHAVRISRNGNTRYRISLDAGTVPADRDFILRWTPRVGEKPVVAAFTEEHDGQTYVLLMAMPPDIDQQAERLARETIFVIDTSGSMSGESIKQARSALIFALERLRPEDGFNIIAFDSTARTLFPAARRASRAALEEARRWVRNLHSGGGTEMMSALKPALEDRAGDGERIRQIIFLTDGCVGNEQQLFSYIRGNLGRSRLFTVGIGSAPNAHFMERAARFGRGTFTYVGSTSEVEEAMRGLFRRLENPVLTDFEVDWFGRDAEMWPDRIPDLYLGQPIVLTARLDSVPKSVGIGGRTGREAWGMRIPLGSPERRTGIHRLWARRKIAAEMDRSTDGVPADEIRKHVVEIALEHHLVSKFTSLVAVDVTPVRPDGADSVRGAVPANLPKGWDFERVFGRVPQTATPGRLFLILGFMLLLTAVIVLRIGSDRAV